MKIRSLLAILLCIVLTASMLTACGSKKQEGSDAEQEVENEEVKEGTEEVQEESQEPAEEPQIPDGLVYSGQTLADAARPVYNNDMQDNYSGEVLSDTGVNYTWTAGEALRSILFENLTINTAEYNTVSFRIRSWTGDEFLRWRLYIHSDLGGNLQTYKDDTQNKEDYFIEIMSDGTGTNTELYTVTEPDADGWITVTFDAGSLNYWKNASVIDGFRIGWVNFGTDQEIAEVVVSQQ